MDELIELAKDYANIELALRRAKTRIVDAADAQGYVEALMIDDPVHFQIAGIRFTPKREFSEGAEAQAPKPPQDESEDVAVPKEMMIDNSDSPFRQAHNLTGGEGELPKDGLTLGSPNGAILGNPTSPAEAE